MSAFAHGVVAGGAGAVGACAVCTQVAAVTTGAGVALIVMAIVFAVCVAIVQVVHMILMNDGPVSAVGAVGVCVSLRVAVRCSGSHDNSLVCTCTSVTMWLMWWSFKLYMVVRPCCSPSITCASRRMRR